MSKQVVVTGIRATGRMHLGNYLGVLRRLGELSRDPDKQCFFFVADLHTLTTLKESADIRRHAPEIVRDIIAAGVDMERSVIYVQSDVPSVTELTWMLACITPDGELGSLPTFKDKAKKHSDDVNAGLRFYPVLMAADILGPRANLVPVGSDQKPHLEITQQIARRFNRIYETDLFPFPDAMEHAMISVPGLVAQNEREGFDKMGKSEDEDITLYLSDSADAMWSKLAKAPTDPARQKRSDPGNPDKCAIYKLHEVISSGPTIAEVRAGCQTAGIGCLDCKRKLAGHITETLADFRERRADLANRPQIVRDVTQAGKAVAGGVFKDTIARARDLMGIGPIS